MKKLKFITAFLAMIGNAMRVSASNYGAEVSAKDSQRVRNRATKKGMRHAANQAGTKMARKAAAGTLTCHHGSPVNRSRWFA